jgi:molybdate transport system substrate-binding protein
MSTVRILSGGAAQGLVRGVQAKFEAQNAVRIEGTFGAVGAMRDKLLAGEPCDLLILSDALIRELAAAGHADASTARPVGVVKTGVALKADAPRRDLHGPEQLQALLQQAGEIYFPDPAKATAGIHFMKVLTQLGLAQTHAQRFRTFPNGATAMAALAQSADASAVGCTQVTEILYTAGVQLIGLLPSPFELATVYTAAVCTRAESPGAARALIEELCSPGNAALRKQGGFDEG